MTKRDFFRVLIKVFGLYFLIVTLFQIIPGNIANFIINFSFELIFVLLFSLSVCFILVYFLFFKSDVIVNLLKLDKDFDDDKIILGTTDFYTLLRLAIVIVGLWFLLDTFPKIIIEVINEFRLKVMKAEMFGYKPDHFNLFVRLINMLIGWLLITNNKSIASFLNKK
jgi:hypothetical protein